MALISWVSYHLMGTKSHWYQEVLPQRTQHHQMATSHNCRQEQQDKPQGSPRIKSLIFHDQNARQPKLLCRQLLEKLEQWEISQATAPKVWRPQTFLSSWLETSKRAPYTSISTTEIKNTNVTQCWRGCGETGSLIHCWQECKWQGHCGKQCNNVV